MGGLRWRRRTDLDDGAEDEEEEEDEGEEAFEEVHHFLALLWLLVGWVGERVVCWVCLAQRRTNCWEGRGGRGGPETSGLLDRFLLLLVSLVLAFSTHPPTHPPTHRTGRCPARELCASWWWVPAASLCAA